MKKSYQSPATTIISLTVKESILALSGNNGGHFDIGLDDTPMGGSQALSVRRRFPWNEGGLWD